MVAQYGESGECRLPAFTIPFVVTSWAFLLFSTGNGVVVRSPLIVNANIINKDLSFPGGHLRSANPLTPEQRIMAMREKSQMALAHIVKLTAGWCSWWYILLQGHILIYILLQGWRQGLTELLPLCWRRWRWEEHLKVKQKQVFLKVGNADRVTEQMNQNGDIQPHMQQPARQDCLTCPRGGHSIGEVCRGVEARGCFACGQAGHFKGAPLCPGDVAQWQSLVVRAMLLGIVWANRSQYCDIGSIFTD